MPRRACLLVPGVDERKIARSTGFQADEIVLDLEDSVPSSGKVQARTAVRQALLRAREVLATLDAAANHGAGAVALHGQMIDEALAVTARRVLEKAGS